MTITGGSLTGGGGGGGTTDNSTETHIPIKQSGALEDSPLHWSGVPGESVISDETIEVPAGSVQVGEGMKMSAAGVIPIFNSLLTGKTYIPTMFEFDETGSNKPFTLTMAAEADLVVQPDFSTSTPLTGMFTLTVTASEFINHILFKCTPSSILGGVRLRIIAQSTGEPIYFFPSKAAWNAGTGEDVLADIAGDVDLDLHDAPLGLLVGELLDVDYIIDTGVILGDGTDPYLAVTRQVVIFSELVETTDSVTVLSDVTSAGSGDIITIVERGKLSGIETLAEVNNISDIDATDLTDGGETTLHSHASSGGDVVIYYEESLAQSSTTSESFQTKVTMNLPVGFVAGDYLIEVNYGWQYRSTSKDFQATALLDAVQLGTFTHRQESADSDSSQRHIGFRRFKKTMTSGVHTVLLQYRTTDNGITASIHDASITITKVEIL